MRLAVITAHRGADSLSQAMLSWGGDAPVYLQDGKDGILPAYEQGLFNSGGDFEANILAYLHDDCIIHDPDWKDRVIREFDDPSVGLVGFGGALGHGSPDLYKAPYDYKQLGRSDFMSNMSDAESHGTRFTGSRDVAVIDGFTLIVRREVLEKSGGWPVNTPVGYVGYDYWLSCMTRRIGYRIRLVGVPCTHLGGRTFVRLGLGQGPEHWEQYLAAHQYIYDTFRSELPYRVSQ